MSVEVRGTTDILSGNMQTGAASNGNKEEWSNRLKECMDEGYTVKDYTTDDYTTKTQVLAAYTKRGEYVPGSYNEEPLIPPIINPPPAVSRRGPNAPYYDSKLTGGPSLRPDARVYTYDNCPSYMRAIIDWSYGRPPGAKNYPRDAEYTKVFYDLSSGNGYKGAFALDPDSNFVWKPGVSSRTLGAYTSKSNVLGAYTDSPNELQRTFEDMVTDRQYAATQYESTLFDAVKKMMDSMGGNGEAIVIDGDVIVLPQNREQPAMTQGAQNSAGSVAQSFLPNANLLRQMRMPQQENEETYRQRLSELGLDTLASL